MTVLADILKAHGDPTLVAAALGRPAIQFTPIAQPAIPVAPTSSPAGNTSVPLNVDRIAVTPAAVSTAPLPLISPSSLPQLPGAQTSWLDWVKAHWPWLVAALLALLVIAYAGRGKSGDRGAAGHGGGAGKGSEAMRQRMADLRARKRKG